MPSILLFNLPKQLLLLQVQYYTYTYTIIIILSFGIVIGPCSYYAYKGLVYIALASPLSR